MSSDEALGALARALPSGVLIRDPDIIRGLSHDDAEWAPVGEPLALVRATSNAEVAAAVRICYDFGVPVTARGAGTGLSGGANAIDGGVILALDRLNRTADQRQKSAAATDCARRSSGACRGRPPEA